MTTASKPSTLTKTQTQRIREAVRRNLARSRLQRTQYDNLKSAIGEHERTAVAPISASKGVVAFKGATASYQVYVTIYKGILQVYVCPKSRNRRV